MSNLLNLLEIGEIFQPSGGAFGSLEAVETEDANVPIVDARSLAHRMCPVLVNSDSLLRRGERILHLVESAAGAIDAPGRRHEARMS